MKAKQAKKTKQWKDKLAKRQNKEEFKAKKGPPTKKKFNKSLADPETFEDEEELDVATATAEPVIWGGNGAHFSLENEGDDGEDEDFGSAKDGNNFQKKKKSGGFQSMGLSPPVLKGIIRRGYKVPTPIQRKTIPLILEGRDVVAMARTGSGKTAAFLIPLFEKLKQMKVSIGEKEKYPKALILSPTRELATQTMKFFRELGKYITVNVVSILGGESMASQFQALHDKPDVVVATPGRFMHLCVEMDFKLDGVEYIVFDEADRLFEMGFGEQVSEILKRLPDNRQTVLFSATLPRVLVDFTKAGLHDPTLIRLDVDTKLPDRLKLVHIACRTEDKLAVLMYLLKNDIDNRDQTIVFVATKHHVEYLHGLLNEANISNCFIYSSLDADARKMALESFRNGKINVLIVTDIAARGIDIPILDNVINFHFPAKPKLFMHRVGRVARAGRSGTAISIVAPDEVAFLVDLHLFLAKPLLTSASVSESDSGGVLLARPPQDCVDEERGYVQSLHNVCAELESLLKVAKNGYSQYLKSRPNASSESNKRAKEYEVAKLPIHSIFGTAYNVVALDNFVTQMQSYRPKSTIFEVGPKAGSDTYKVMQEKRMRDQKTVEKRRTMKPLIDLPDSTVKDDAYVSYLPADHHTETGLSVESTFDKQIQDSVMDLTGDDARQLKSVHTMQRWDRKKKKFVTDGADNKPKKKIKTESGVWISSSYKSDIYKTWQEKSKVAQQTEAAEGSGSEDDSYGNTKTFGAYANQKAVFSKRLVKTGKNEGSGPGKGRRVRSELKRPEEILKTRKVKEAKMAKNVPKGQKKGGKGGKPGFKPGGKFGKGKGGGGPKLGGKSKFKR